MSEFEHHIDELCERIEKLKKMEQKSAAKEARIFALKAEIKRAYEVLNLDDRPLKRDPYWLTDNCDTISCIELTMQHDRRRYVKGWMEGEPRSDNWNGLTDNQLLILEDKEPERRAKSLLDYKNHSVR
jgi:hypothetical protein